MSQPIGYYTSYKPGEEGLLADMHSSWGANFSKLNESERAWMIYQLGYQLWMCADGAVSDAVEFSIQRAQSEINNWDKLGLIEALVHQIKGG